MFSCGATLTTAERMLDGEAMDNLTILIVVLLALAIIGVVWLQFG
jgi:hypothetical protein